MNKRFLFITLFLVMSLMVFGCNKNEESIPKKEKTDIADVEEVEVEEEIVTSEPEVQTAEAEPETEKDRIEASDFVMKDAHFGYNSSAITPDSAERLRETAKWLMGNSINIIIEGHCDERGTNAYNLALGEKRAESAMEFFIEFGISPDRMETISYGEEKPVAFDHNEAAWAKNRRVHIAVK